MPSVDLTVQFCRMCYLLACGAMVNVAFHASVITTLLPSTYEAQKPVFMSVHACAFQYFQYKPAI